MTREHNKCIHLCRIQGHHGLDERVHSPATVPHLWKEGVLQFVLSLLNVRAEITSCKTFLASITQEKIKGKNTLQHYEVLERMAPTPPNLLTS